MAKLSNCIIIIAMNVFFGCSLSYMLPSRSTVESNGVFVTSLQQTKIDTMECSDSTRSIKVYMIPYLDDTTTLKGDFFIQYFDGGSHFMHMKASEQPLLLKLERDTEFLLIYYDLADARIERSLFNLKINKCYAFSFYMKTSMFRNKNIIQKIDQK